MNPLRRCSVHDVGFGITGAKVIVEQIPMKERVLEGVLIWQLRYMVAAKWRGGK